MQLKSGIVDSYKANEEQINLEKKMEEQRKLREEQALKEAAERKANTKMDLSGSVAYKSLYLNNEHKIKEYQVMCDKSLKPVSDSPLFEEGTAPTFLQRVISLPNDRMFMIGGAADT